jgi:KUP system potassium uptake protein
MALAPPIARHGSTVSGNPALLSLAALGVVFGDIGTSPLYTLKTVIALTGTHTDAGTTLGALSLIIWTLTIVTSVKYVAFAMRIDNYGEGGILALMSLLGIKRGYRPTIIAMGLLGAALIYGDGAITPAISVLSALEGLNMVAPSFAAYVVPASVAILVLLFAIQPRGTATIGRAFGPIMALWFLVIAVLGLWGIASHPGVLAAINPIFGLDFLRRGGRAGFLVLGGVFLCVTGAEALYADMGHFGAPAIRRAWFFLVFPALGLNYAGQAGLVMSGAPTADNTFYRLCPPHMLIPLVILATVATIIASQAIIAGAFSMTRQAILLGWLPRMTIRQTSPEGYGQIYIGAINWLLMLVTVGLAIGFQKSDNLAAAYGIAVSLTMLMTSGLLFVAMREIWHWSFLRAGAVSVLFIVIDSGFVAANFVKIGDGGYVPLILALLVYGLMLIWHTGLNAIARQTADSVILLKDFIQELEQGKVARVPGTAVFVTRAVLEVPPSMVWHVKHNRALHERILVLTVRIESVPWITDAQRVELQELAPNFWRGIARYGFMERADVPGVLAEANACGCKLDLSDVTYYVGCETIIPREGNGSVPRWVAAIFALMHRNAARLSEYLNLPRDAVVEIGREIAL